MILCAAGGINLQWTVRNMEESETRIRS